MGRRTDQTRSTAGGRPLRACILDFDGVIADTEPLHAEAKRRTLDRYGIAYSPTLFDAFKGRTDVDFFDYVAAELSPTSHDPSVLLEAKRREYATLFKGVKLMPGFTSFLPLARRRFELLGIATSATRHDFELVARRFDFARSIDTVVTSDDTVRFKPDPEPYLVAWSDSVLPPTRRSWSKTRPTASDQRSLPARSWWAWIRHSSDGTSRPPGRTLWSGALKRCQAGSTRSSLERERAAQDGPARPAREPAPIRCCLIRCASAAKGPSPMAWVATMGRIASGNSPTDER